MFNLSGTIPIPFEGQLAGLQVDALVDHFMRFQTEERALPVVWHQSLLCFVQR